MTLIISRKFPGQKPYGKPSGKLVVRPRYSRDEAAIQGEINGIRRMLSQGGDIEAGEFTKEWGLLPGRANKKT